MDRNAGGAVDELYLWAGGGGPLRRGIARSHSRNEARSKALLIRGSGLEMGGEALWFPINEEFVDIFFISLDITCCFLVGR